MHDGLNDSRGFSVARLFEGAQRIFARIDDLPAFLDQVAQVSLELLEEVDARHARAGHLLGAAGLLTPGPEAGVFRPLRLKGRPDPDELQSFVEHVGPGDTAHPTGLMGWAAARRVVALREGDGWWLAQRDDARDRWAPLRVADAQEADEMRRAAISAYPSIRTQLAIPVLDTQIRGQARPRDPIGILNVESDEPISDLARQLLIAFGGSIGYPLIAALRRRDIRLLSRRLALPLGRRRLARALLDATLPYLPGRSRRGFVALRDVRSADRFMIEAITPPQSEAPAPSGAGGRGAVAGEGAGLELTSDSGIWGAAIRACRTQYLPDLSRGRPGDHHAFWADSRSIMVVPLVSGDRSECFGLLSLESGETSYAFSMQDRAYFGTAAAIAAVAAIGLREPTVDYEEAVDLDALRRRLRRAEGEEVPDDQIVRVNSICRALIKHGFSFPQAAEEARLSVHVLREYTSRAPRIIDVSVLRSLAARREETLRLASSPDTWELHESF
ncbi:MAG: GAF domain-containing protein [Candidatus Eisenbacteria bacterium]|nr:GAF domain-containing protein [Candidatus Eisenbacteria bacterium]